MKLIYVSGFLRSGTTYMLNMLRSHPDCTGGPEEQGLDFMWATNGYGDTLDEIERYNAMLAPLNAPMSHFARMGLYFAKSMVERGAAVLDEYALAGNNVDAKCLVSKRPTFTLFEGWPEDYIERSSLFTDYRMVIMKRRFGPLLKSLRNKFPALLGTSWEFLQERYDMFYARIPKRNPKWIVVNYEDIPKDVESKRLENLLELPGLRMHEEFRT